MIRLAGRLAEAQVPELMQVCAAGGPISLDLTDLVFPYPAQHYVLDPKGYLLDDVATGIIELFTREPTDHGHQNSTR